MRPWWEQLPERWTYESAALAAAGIRFRRDEAALREGILRLHIDLEIDGQPLPLVVTFPDLYPYFRFHVDAPTLELAHHQNPLCKSLCLLGRATHHWQTTDTVASLLREQLPRVLSSGRESAKEAVEGVEQQQAEPYSEYYPYPVSMIMVDSGDVFRAPHARGTFTIKTSEAPGPPPTKFIRGTVCEVRGRSNEVVFAAESRLLRPFHGPKLEGCWVRVPAPIAHADQEAFLKALLDLEPAVRTAKINKVPGGWLQVWAVLFPEENKWRSIGEGGIVFVCLFNRKREKMAQVIRAAEPIGSNQVRSKWKKKPK